MSRSVFGNEDEKVLRLVSLEYAMRIGKMRLGDSITAKLNGVESGGKLIRISDQKQKESDGKTIFGIDTYKGVFPISYAYMECNKNQADEIERVRNLPVSKYRYHGEIYPPHALEANHRNSSYGVLSTYRLHINPYSVVIIENIGLISTEDSDGKTRTVDIVD